MVWNGRHGSPLRRSKALDWRSYPGRLTTLRAISPLRRAKFEERLQTPGFDEGHDVHPTQHHPSQEAMRGSLTSRTMDWEPAAMPLLPYHIGLIVRLASGPAVRTEALGGPQLGTVMNGRITPLMGAYIVLVAIVVIVGFPVLAPYVWLSEWRASRRG